MLSPKTAQVGRIHEEQYRCVGMAREGEGAIF